MDRSIQLTRGVIDLETGEFPATLVTNGPASDPHILDIRTLRAPDSFPMFANHDADPIGQLGTMFGPRKAGKSTRLGGASLKVTGRIDVQGDSLLADIRRDVAERMSRGDISQLSVRWGHDEQVVNTPRSDMAALKKVGGEFAYSDVTGGFETAMFIQYAPVLEGSIVGLGADQAALVGRSQDLTAPEHVRDFYRMLTLTAPERAEETEPEMDLEFDDSDLDKEEMQPEPVTAPETSGREEPGHSGEVLDIPAELFASGSSSLQEIGAFIRDLEKASKAQLDAGVKRLLFERRGIL